MANDEIFEKALAFVLKWEGGYVNDPADKGGATNKGITQNTYNSWLTKQKKPINNVKNIKSDEVKAIYYQNYWRASGCNLIQNNKLAVAMFNTAVNRGVTKAQQYRNETKGDLQAFLKRCETGYRNIVANDLTQKKFLQGWLNRIEALTTYLLTV